VGELGPGKANWLPGVPQRVALAAAIRPRCLACRLTCAFAPCIERGFPFRRFPTSWGVRVAVLRSWRAAGPQAYRVSVCWLAGWAAFAQMFLNPRRTRAGVSRPGGTGRSQGRRRSSASGRARRSWAWQMMMSQVHRPAAGGSRTWGAVHPRTCLNTRKACSRSKRRKYAYHSRSISPGAAPVWENHNHTGFGSRSPGRRSTCSLIRVPSITGSGPSWSSQAARWVSRGCPGPGRTMASPYPEVTSADLPFLASLSLQAAVIL
jgi:hypothetical protein